MLLKKFLRNRCRERRSPSLPETQDPAEAQLCGVPQRRVPAPGFLQGRGEQSPAQGLSPGEAIPSACTAAARFTRWSASSMASAGPSGSSRDSPMTRIRISVSSRMGTSEHRRRKKLWGGGGVTRCGLPTLAGPEGPRSGQPFPQSPRAGGRGLLLPLQPEPPFAGRSPGSKSRLGRGRRGGYPHPKAFGATHSHWFLRPPHGRLCHPTETKTFRAVKEPGARWQR